MEKIWKIRKQVYADEILQLLYNRGIIKEDDSSKTAEKFLHPNFERDFHDPTSMPGYSAFELRIIQASKNKEKVGIFADYDADGVPGAAFLYKTLGIIDIKPIVYIPTREMGYGFNKEGIDFLIDEGCKLIISVDLGIKEFENAKYISKKKCELIITDHHLPDDKLPKALAVINPRVRNSKYPFKELSGAGVVFKLIQGLRRVFPTKITDSFLKWNLDLVAISTISDVVPLVNENRLISKFGLITLQKTRNLGLAELYKAAGINQAKLTTFEVGFQIAPRINAPGRIDQATTSFELLTTSDLKEAKRLASKINEKNILRQTMMDQVELEVMAKVAKENLDKNKIIIVSGDWPKGVIGPSASRLVEKYFRPVIILSREGNQLSGSSRSISCFNIVEGLAKAEEYLEGFGGHKGAAGLQLEVKSLKKFVKEMIKIAGEMISDQDLVPKVNIDLVLNPHKISLELFNRFAKLEPYGLGNPRPVLLAERMELKDFRFVGREDKHLKLVFNGAKQDIEAIYFSHQLDKDFLKTHTLYDIVFTPDINCWNGNEKPSLKVIDIKPHVVGISNS